MKSVETTSDKCYDISEYYTDGGETHERRYYEHDYDSPEEAHFHAVRDFREAWR